MFARRLKQQWKFFGLTKCHMQPCRRVNMKTNMPFRCNLITKLVLQRNSCTPYASFMSVCGFFFILYNSFSKCNNFLKKCIFFCVPLFPLVQPDWSTEASDYNYKQPTYSRDSIVFAIGSGMIITAFVLAVRFRWDEQKENGREKEKNRNKT